MAHHAETRPFSRGFFLLLTAAVNGMSSCASLGCGNPDDLKSIVGYWSQSDAGGVPTQFIAYLDGAKIGWAYNGEEITSIRTFIVVSDCTIFADDAGRIRLATESNHVKQVDFSGGHYLLTWDLTNFGDVTADYRRTHPNLAANARVTMRFSGQADLAGETLQVRHEFVFIDAISGSQLSTENDCHRLQRAMTCTPFPLTQLPSPSNCQ